MHCRCGLVFCYKCGGVLKATAAKSKATGVALQVCACGNAREQELAAHDNPRALNHNRPDQVPQGAAGRAAQAAHVAAMHAAMARVARRGGGGGGGGGGFGAIMGRLFGGGGPPPGFGDDEDEDYDDDDEF